MTISIITVNLNNDTGLEKTCMSIRIQTSKNYQFIVIDGNSTDNSKLVIEQNKDIIYYSVSEHDKGIYDAMNKGLDIATGDFVLFLNSGDVLYDEKILETVSKMAISSSVLYFGSAKTIGKKDAFYLFPAVNSTENMIKSFLKYYRPNHQTIFFPKFFYHNNRYNIQYKIASDEDYKLRALQKCKYCFLNIIIVSFPLGGFSYPNNFKKINQIVQELGTVHKLHQVYKTSNQLRLFLTLVIKFIFFKLLGDNSFWFLSKYNSKYNTVIRNKENPRMNSLIGGGGVEF
jgi:glycosyltransferase involved in cell wall biosynthesis